MIAETNEQVFIPIDEFLNVGVRTIEANDTNEEEPNSEIYYETKQKRSKKLIYGKGNEALAVKKELGDFDAFRSTTYEYIIKMYGRSVRFTELLGIISSIQFYLQYKENIALPSLSRNEKRSYPLLIKYIERNSENILPYFQYISLCDSSFKKIKLDLK